MNGKHYIGRRVSHVEKYDEVGPITGVALLLDENNEITAGDQNGFVLEVTCPYGTQAMANNILAKVRGQTYKGYRADNAPLPIEAELGDGVTVDGLYSLLAYRSVNFGPGHFSEIAAPGEKELQHEYHYLTPTEKLQRKIATTNSRITKTAEMIRLEVNNEVDGLYSSLELTATSLTTKINDVNRNLSSEIKQTADSLTVSINDVNKGLSSKIEQTTTSLTTQINNTKTGLSSEIKQTADSLSASINNVDGRVTSIKTTVDGLSVDVNGANGKFSKLQQKVDSFTLTVSNGSTSSTISLKANNATISSQTITMDGLVTFTGLSQGTTTINGACIKTGTIDAAYLNLTGAITFSDLNWSTQNKIDNAVDDAADALSGVNDLANGDYYGTFISGTTIYSPTLRTNYLDIYATSNGSGGLSLYARVSGNQKEMFAVNYYRPEAQPYVEIGSPADAVIRFYGQIDFSYATVTGLE